MACARALREHPGVNASYGDDCVIVHERVNIGLALALDDGLTVPVILDADALALEGLAVERLRLAEAARTRAPARRGDLRRARSASRTSVRSASTASRRSCCRRRPRSWPSARCATPSASRARSITAPSTAHRRRASSRRSPSCWPSPAWALAAPRAALEAQREARAQRRGDARQIERGARARALAAGRTEPGLAGGDVIGAAGLVVQRRARGSGARRRRRAGRAPAARSRCAPRSRRPRGSGAAPRRRCGRPRGAAAPRARGRGARARCRGSGRRSRRRRAGSPDSSAVRAAPRRIERRLELAGLREGDADLAIADRGGAHGHRSTGAPGGRVRALRCCGGRLA